MSAVLAAASFVTVVGALVAITGRDARVALIGLLVALVAAPLLADPPTESAALGVRVVAALLGGYLLFMTLRDTTAVTRGSLVGLPAETLAAAAAYVVGYGTHGLGSAALGPSAASATGFALAVIAVAPIVRGADVFRLGVALAILVTGAELIRVGLAGTPAPLEQLVTAGLTLALLGTVAVLCANAVAATGGLALRNEPRRSALFEAHPITPTAARSLSGSWRPSWRPRRRTPDTEPTRPAAHRIGPAAVADPVARRPTPASERPTRTDGQPGDGAQTEQLPLALDDSLGLAGLAVLRGLDDVPGDAGAAWVPPEPGVADETAQLKGPAQADEPADAVEPPKADPDERPQARPDDAVERHQADPDERPQAGPDDLSAP